MKKIVLILSVMFFFATETTCFAVNMPKPLEKSREELYHDLFITLLSPKIDRHVDAYYSNFLSDSPTVYPYMVDVIQAERVHGYRTFKFKVGLEVTPVVGPHISVGKDRLTFEITTEPKLIKFEHIKTHELPENWQHILK